MARTGHASEKDRERGGFARLFVEGVVKPMSGQYFPHQGQTDALAVWFRAEERREQV